MVLFEIPILVNLEKSKMSHSFSATNDLLDVMDGLKTDVPLHAVKNDATKDYSLLVVFDRHGNVLLQSGTEAEADPVWIESLKKTALLHLESESVAQFYFPCGEGRSRLDVWGAHLDSSVVLVAWPCGSEETIAKAAHASDGLSKLLDVLVGQMHGILEENNRFSARIEHSQAEQKMLSETEAEAIRQAYEQREQRFREKQEYLHSLYHLQKMELIGHLSAGIAHEINTPMQYIGNNITFLRRAFESLTRPLKQLVKLVETRENAEDPVKVIARIARDINLDEVQYLLEEIPFAITQSKEGVDRVTQIVRSVKDFSYPNSENQQEVNLNEVLRKVLLVSRGEWKYVAKPETDFQEDLPGVFVCEGECSQIFLNLVVNAAHAIEGRFANEEELKGVIRLQTRQVGDHIEIRVSDNGLGIPEEIRDKIFDPFFTTKEMGQGTGQGLAIVQSIVQKYHGTLTFETVIGEGSTFIVNFPLDTH